MIAYCTYCSADKHYSKTAVNALNLYNSSRINRVYEVAKNSRAPFVILSGKFGLIDPNEQISYYDHLLLSPEVESHSKLIASQIKSKNITAINFYTNSIKMDKNLQPYIDCITKACAQSSIRLNIIEEKFED